MMMTSKEAKEMLRANETGKEINWQDWLTRWHHQQAGYLPQRAGRFELMLDYVSKQRGTGELKILDLCSGPGSISEVALKRFPNASIVAVDYDPWLLEIGRQVPGLDRIRWVEADLRNDDWLREVAPASFDAVLSATALHWFKADELVHLYKNLAGVMAEGGIFLNADHQLVRAPQLTEIGRQLRQEWQVPNFKQSGVEDWEQYWGAARAEPAFKELIAERDLRFGQGKHGIEVTVNFHQEALLAAGFQEVGEVWRYENDAFVAAIR
jgi:ubiquinone/menaquinone biosynthesis C-methylase UbiE